MEVHAAVPGLVVGVAFGLLSRILLCGGTLAGVLAVGPR